MRVYHGSILEISAPKIVTSEIGRDFGFAFYTTAIKEQAERWALRRARIASRKENKFVPAVVNIYEWKHTEVLNEMNFDEASVDWLEMVVRCRSDIHFGHEYDIISGKIANDNVGETVSYVIQGIMRKEDAVERLKFQKINNQIAFCTEKSLKQIAFIGSYIVEEK